MVNNGCQSAMLRSYYLAIKSVLHDDRYVVDDNKVLLNALARACHPINDKVRTRLPIHSRLLEMLLFELQQMFNDQPFLETMNKAIWLIQNWRFDQWSASCKSM